MHDISKHDSEEKGEGNASEYCRVHLLVAWNTISVNNLLEDTCEFIALKKGWLRQSCNFIWSLLNVQTRKAMNLNDLSNLLVEVEGFGSPNQAVSELASVLKHVQMVVDCLFSLDE